MVEKDVEYNIKTAILNNSNKAVTITNEFSTDGIVRFNQKPVAILEFKNKRDLSKDVNRAQIMVQSMCYYYKLTAKESLDYNKPFYLIMGDDNEIFVLNLHQLPANWLINKKWGEVAPSRAKNEKDLMEVAESMLKIANLIYYKYEDIKELSFGFHLIFNNLI